MPPTLSVEIMAGVRRRWWRTMPSETPGVGAPTGKRLQFRARFPFAGCWVYLGLYPSREWAHRVGSSARALPAADKKLLANCRGAKQRRKLLAKLLQQG